MYSLSTISLRVRHHQTLAKIVIALLDIYYTPFSAQEGNQNRRTGLPVEHAGLFFRKGAYSRYEAPSEML
jgi:hypothetical protein